MTQHALSMLLPSVTYHARVRMWTADNKTASPFSPVTTFVTYDHGSCGNTPDMNRVRAAKPALSKDIQSCLVVRHAPRHCVFVWGFARSSGSSVCVLSACCAADVAAG